MLVLVACPYLTRALLKHVKHIVLLVICVFCLFLHICHSCSLEVLHQGGDSRVNFSNPLSDTGDCPGQLRVAIDGSHGSPLPCSPSCYTH
jgi:hypothetical protein